MTAVPIPPLVLRPNPPQLITVVIALAPRMPTIIVALVLVLIGLLGTFGGMLPSVAGMSSETLGAWSFVVATIVLLAGMVFQGI